MESSENYIAINKKAWDQRTEVHVDSDFYDNATFLKTKQSLNDIELAILGDLSGKKVLHLQCHFGQDSISLAQLGAKVTGVDFSPKAIEKAKQLAIETETEVEFICADIYDLPNHLNQSYDLVFSSYGTIGWMPDINKWAGIVSHFLKSNGQLLLVEFHPAVWMYDNDFKGIEYGYFNSKPIVEVEQGTYTDSNAPIETTMVTWNHPLSDVVNAAIANNLSIDLLNEYNYSPYDCFAGTKKIGEKQFIVEKLGEQFPLVYALKCTKHKK
ncbi:MAG: class I SAM-dependent methyltransferase [Putridiphycobacter sp.]|nr:class I SAM-dependent methyltransferase [Putridiphycobacter sp.]